MAEAEQFLLSLCDAIYRAEAHAQEERKRELFGDQPSLEFLLMRQDKIRVEIRKENVNHNAPHIHVTHSDKIDVSISLINFQVLAGNIDNKTLKHLRNTLVPLKEKLNAIWIELNEKENSIGAEKLISNLCL